MIALLECREARAREELESWLQALREAEEHAAAARQRVEHARIAREELLRALAEEGEDVERRGESGPGTASVQAKANDLPSVPVAGPAGAAVPVAVPQTASAGAGGGAAYDPRPPQWRAGLGEEVLSGVYRQVFAAAAAAPGPVTAQELTRALGRDAERMNEVEKVRHRAYALEAQGWPLLEARRERSVQQDTRTVAQSTDTSLSHSSRPSARADHPRPSQRFTDIVLNHGRQLVTEETLEDLRI
ncbi:hypothetical protein FCI23_53200 [Actinacidiphila oryziradicis]|uniref:PH domain-containing protein n=1 Tax=Actinacidiphila oryziradicis TaxID=2571141 RepID=A0A4U0RGI5_9ACTN|nr:hypothetical protein FCI23_53200 [Actinacidiphila oryziradicis]